MSPSPDRKTPKSTPPSARRVTVSKTSPALRAAIISITPRSSSSGTRPSASRTRSAAVATSDQLVNRILGRAEAWRLEAACARALRFGDLTYRTLKHILDQGLEVEAPLSMSTAPPARTFVRSAAELLGHVFGGLTWN